MGRIAFIPFRASNGSEYELEVDLDGSARASAVQRLVEDGRGRITAEPTGWEWDGLIEMTNDLRIAILSWRSDPGN